MPQRGWYRKNALVDARQAQRCIQGTFSGFLLLGLEKQGILIRIQSGLIRYISDTAQCSPALCLEAIPDRTPPPWYPPYDYSRFDSQVVPKKGVKSLRERGGQLNRGENHTEQFRPPKGDLHTLYILMLFLLNPLLHELSF